MSDTGRNLIVVAHPDDEILGFGAAGAKLVAQGEEVQPVILCGSVDARTRRPEDEQLRADILSANETVKFNMPILGSFPNIRMNTVGHLELVQFIEQQIEEFKPTRIFTHHPSDLNDDHRCVSRACLPAARLSQRKGEISTVPSLFFMETPSATDWAFATGDSSFNPNIFIEVDDFIDLKSDALDCYTNVLRPFPHPRSREAIRALAMHRGAQSGVGMAEAFQCVFSRFLS